MENELNMQFKINELKQQVRKLEKQLISIVLEINDIKK